ncbi:MAG: hypothetical protein KAX49_08830 [Halanaerobiales bacterium]|nr:hypothetical protein [Halanaerobiales bacterium]
MKRKIIRISLVVLLIIFGVFLYSIGKEHKIYVDNKDFTIADITYSATTTYRVWIDGDEVGDVKKGKRKVAKIPGLGHKVVVEEIDGKELTGKKYEMKFRLKPSEVKVTINIPAMINEAKEWIIKEKN